MKTLFSVFLLLFFAQANAQNCNPIVGFDKIGSFETHGYYLSDQKMTWQEAHIFAQDHGGYLVSIQSQAENDFLKQQLDNNMVFIGWNDAQIEGEPAWANGDPVTFDVSSGNTPYGDYGVMNFWNGNWEYGGKWQQRKFVMEMDCTEDGNDSENTDDSASSQSPIQVFIFSGQSNMSGAGITSELNPVLTALPPNVTVEHLFYGSYYFDFSCGNFGPEIEFVHEIAADHPNQQYHVIKYARGGTWLHEWLPDSLQYNILVDFVEESLEDLEGNYEIASLVWMQGENDAFNPESASQYLAGVTSLVHGLRDELSAPNMSVLIGQSQPPTACCTSVVNEAQSSFASADSHAIYVATDGLERIPTNMIHYNNVGLIDLGSRFYQAYKTLTESSNENNLVINCPDDVQAFIPNTNGVSINWDAATASSGCGDVAISLVAGPQPGANLEEGTYLVKYMATDNCQQSATCQFAISVGVSNSSACPTSYSGFGSLGAFAGHTYFLSDELMSWQDADQKCTQLGGHLAVISSLTENNFLKTKLQASATMAFVGFSDMALEGEGVWSDGSMKSIDLSYSNNDNNDFAVMDFWAGNWQMVNQWVAKQFILEMDCNSSPAPAPTANEGSASLTIFPNPVQTELTIFVERPAEKETIIQVFNVYGQLFLTENKNLPQGSSWTTIDVSQLPKGFYFVKLGQGEIRRFLKE